MSVSISVPATLANLGSGYDALGLAVSLVNRFQVRRGAWSVHGEPVDPADHLMLATARHTMRRFDLPEIAFGVTTDERVPRARGMGSSATARVAGALAAFAVAEVEPPREALLAFLADAEGHPDNVWPALLGGLVICGERPKVLAVHPALGIALCVPSREVSTPAARAALPPIVAHGAAVRGLRSVALLVAGLLDGDLEAIREGVLDGLHQPWRAPLIGPVGEAFAGARALGGAPFVGGSGSTLAAFTAPDVDPVAVADALAAPFRAQGVPCRCQAVRPTECGAVVAADPDPPAS